MNGATLNVYGHGVILSGNSGVGKSTLSSLFVSYLGAKRITRDANGVCYFYGSPFDRTEALKKLFTISLIPYRQNEYIKVVISMLRNISMQLQFASFYLHQMHQTLHI